MLRVRADKRNERRSRWKSERERLLNQKRKFSTHEEAGDEPAGSKTDDMKEKLRLWQEEKRKKKLEAQKAAAKKPVFKVQHLTALPDADHLVDLPDISPPKVVPTKRLVKTSSQRVAKETGMSKPRGKGSLRHQRPTVASACHAVCAQQPAHKLTVPSSKSSESSYRTTFSKRPVDRPARSVPVKSKSGVQSKSRGKTVGSSDVKGVKSAAASSQVPTSNLAWLRGFKAKTESVSADFKIDKITQSQHARTINKSPTAVITPPTADSTPTRQEKTLVSKQEKTPVSKETPVGKASVKKRRSTAKRKSITSKTPVSEADVAANAEPVEATEMKDTPMEVASGDNPKQIATPDVSEQADTTVVSARRCKRRSTRRSQLVCIPSPVFAQIVDGQTAGQTADEQTVEPVDKQTAGLPVDKQTAGQTADEQTVRLTVDEQTVEPADIRTGEQAADGCVSGGVSAVDCSSIDEMYLVPTCSRRSSARRRSRRSSTRRTSTRLSTSVAQEDRQIENAPEDAGSNNTVTAVTPKLSDSLNKLSVDSSKQRRSLRRSLEQREADSQPDTQNQLTVADPSPPSKRRRSQDTSSNHLSAGNTSSASPLLPAKQTPTHTPKRTPSVSRWESPLPSIPEKGVLKSVTPTQDSFRSPIGTAPRSARRYNKPPAQQLQSQQQQVLADDVQQRLRWNLLKSSPNVEFSRKRQRTPSPKNRQSPETKVSPLSSLLFCYEKPNMAPSPMGSPELSFTKPVFKYQDTESAVARFDADSVPVENQSSESSTAAETSNTSANLTQKTVIDGEHNVPYFRLMLEREFSRLDSLCEQWKFVEQADHSINDDARGQVMSAVGKAQLLVTQRFQQFLGLVNDSEANTGEKPITCTDLDGFWDMIDIQIDDVNRLFRELISLRANNWIAPSPPKPVAVPARKPLKRRVNKAEAKKTDSKPKIDRAAQRRKMMAEARAKQKALAQQQEQQQSNGAVSINEEKEVAMDTQTVQVQDTPVAEDAENIAPLPKKTPRRRSTKTPSKTPRRSTRISLLYTPNTKQPSTLQQPAAHDLMSFSP